MRRLFANCPTAFRILCLLCGCGVVGAPGLRAAPTLRSASNAHFEVVGLDLRSVNYVNELSLFAAETAERYLEPEGMAFPLPILVTLRPEEHAKFEDDHRIRIEARGAVELDVRWEDPMTLERMCHHMAEALLVQYAVFNHGQGAVESLRAWTVDALAREIYYGLRPADFVALLQHARGMEAPALAEIAEAPRLDSGAVAAGYGFWLLEGIKSSGLERRAVRSLFQQAVAGIDIEEALASAVQPTDPTVESLPVEVWWNGQLVAMLEREYEVVEAMDSSRQWMANLARFDAPLALEDGEVSLNLRSLYKHRNLAEVRGWVEARLDILRLRMLRINPAYYNPARSLGVLFEALLEDAPAHEYLHALAIYLSDWEDAKEMQDLVEEKLGGK